MVVSGMIIIAGAIGCLFWYNEWVYSLPTPVPSNYHPVKSGEFVDLKEHFKEFQHKPLFIHFFNPDCPCSRFNIPHFKSLVAQYGDRIAFVVVVMNKDKVFSEEEVQDKLGLKLPVLSETEIANNCGVYSTPQAVILDEQHKLYYRGNYNKSRYCTEKQTAFARIALDSMLINHHKPIFDELALKAYGCQIPKCTLQ